MNIVKYGCGIDIAKDTFDACLGAISFEDGYNKLSTAQFDNTPAGFKKYVQWIKKQCRLPVPCIHLMEASGIYYEDLAMHLAVRESQPVVVMLPNKAKKYKESLGFKSKTDGIDALALSRMACEQQHTPWTAPDEKLYSLRLITRQIESVIAQSTAVKNRLEALTHGAFRNKELEKLLLAQVTFFKHQKQALIQSMEELIEHDSDLKQRFDNIKKIKGVSTLTIATVVAETGGFALFENIAQLISYAGYDVVENQSGKHSGKTKISKKGNGRIRRSLYFPALSVVRYHIYPFKQLYERIVERNKIKMKGYVAVQKKLLIIIYTLWKNNEAFKEQPNTNTTSKEKEMVSSFTSVAQQQNSKKVVRSTTDRTTQDKHPSKHRRMSSFT